MSESRIALWSALLVAAALGAGAGFGAWYLWLAPKADTPQLVQLMPLEPPPPATELIGTDGPEFDLPGIGRENVTLADRRGKLVLVNFWATWCEPCREEMPLLQRLYDEFKGRGFEVVGLASDDRDKVAEFVREFGIGFPIAYGEMDVIRLSQQYGNRIGGLPYSVLIERDGRIAYIKSGLLREAPLRAEIAARM
ncbi:MAG: TlpA disulfide reductase family protein [Pseudomonadota bacterium]